MCRLFAYVHSGTPRSMRETLGSAVVDEFQALAEVHRDGWGAAWHQKATLSRYVTTKAAHLDQDLFHDLTNQPVDSAIVHERLASPGIGLTLDNQQPFTSGGIAFAHNGSIANAEGNIVQRPLGYRESLGLVHSTTQSDSQIYAELFLLHLGRVRLHRRPEGPPTVDEVHRALAETIAVLRRDYPEASFNNVIETPDFTFATRAHPEVPRASEGLRRRYEEAGWAHRIDSYPELGAITLAHPDGSVTSAVSSSGYPATDGWARANNNTLVVLSHADGSLKTLSLATA